LHPVMRAILVVCVLMLGATEASAKKFRFFHVGGGGHSEEIVKVLDLPDIPQLRRADGRHIDLGYKFTSGGGEWVGYVGDDGKYLALSEDAVQVLLAMAGVDRLPPVPERPASTESGAGSVFNHATVASGPGGTRSDRTSPLPISITPATTDRACTSSPTQLPSFITGASRNCGPTAGPLPTATRANLRARRRVTLHTV
jgi:hypothetical protein